MRVGRLAAMLAVAACAAGDTAPGFSERDSAGVVIATSDAPVGAPGTWRVVEPPLLQLGELEGASDYLFSNVRGVVRLADGTLVVADGGSYELRYYDPAGRFVGRAGGRGDGPGEFSDIARVWREGETVAVESSRTRRVTRYDGSGQLIGVVTLPMSERPYPLLAVGALGGGRLVAVQALSVGVPGQVVVQDSLAYVLLDPSGVAPDGDAEFARLPGQKRFFIAAAGALFTMPVPYEPAPSVAVSDSIVVLGSGRLPELAVYDAGGELRRVVRWRQAAEPITAALRDSVRELTRERGRSGPAELYDQMLAAMEFPEHGPAYSALRIDDAARLWVRRSTIVADAPSEWHVFSPAGRWLTTVRLPTQTTLMGVRGDELLAVQRDDLDVERVMVYRLEAGR